MATRERRLEKESWRGSSGEIAHLVCERRQIGRIIAERILEMHLIESKWPVSSVEQAQAASEQL